MCTCVVVQLHVQCVLEANSWTIIGVQELVGYCNSVAFIRFIRTFAEVITFIKVVALEFHLISYSSSFEIHHSIYYYNYIIIIILSVTYRKSK